MRKIIICLLFAAFISSSVAVAQNSAAANLYLQTSEVHHLMVQFEADRGSLNRFYFVTNSPERRARLRQLYAAELRQDENGRES
jgi:hypothetical protein